jgi:hypothetical protein
MRRSLLLLTTLFCCWCTAVAQSNNEIRLWSDNKKLSAHDFAIKTQRQETASSSAQFSIDFQIRGINLFTRNFNKKVRNYLVRSASWIDTTANVEQALRYQQTLFDISEIYVRKMRKFLKENKTKIVKATALAEELNTQYSKDFPLRRIAYDKETHYGTDEAKQREWEAQIKKELGELSDFAYDS